MAQRLKIGLKSLINKVPKFKNIDLNGKDRNGWTPLTLKDKIMLSNSKNSQIWVKVPKSKTIDLNGKDING